MSKNFLKKIKESVSHGNVTKNNDNTKKTDLKSVADVINSAKNWDQLEESKNLIINFIKNNNITSNSPEYMYVLRLYRLRKKILSSNRMSEGDDDVDWLRSAIKNIIREQMGDMSESLNWDDKDESWSSDENWGKDPNWVQGDAGGSDAGGSNSGGGSYDSFMAEDDEFDWITSMPTIGDLKRNGRVLIYMPKTYTVHDKNKVIEALSLQGYNTYNWFLKERFIRMVNLYTIILEDGEICGWDTYSSFEDNREGYKEEGMLPMFIYKNGLAQIINLQ